MVSVYGELERGTDAGGLDSFVSDCRLPMIQALFPHGDAWVTVRQVGEQLYKYAQGISREFCRVDARAEQLIVEAYPGTTTELIADWEEFVGVDECLLLDPDIAVRRARVTARLTDKTSLNPDDIVAKVLADTGEDAFIIEADCKPMACDSPCDWALYQTDWRYRTDIITRDAADSEAACLFAALMPGFSLDAYTEGAAPEWLTDCTFAWRAGDDNSVATGGRIVQFTNLVDSGALDFTNPDEAPPYEGAELQCGGHPYPYFWASGDTVNYLTGDTIANLFGSGPEWHAFIVFTINEATVSGASPELAHRMWGNDGAVTRTIGVYFQDDGGGTLNVHPIASDGTILSTTHAGTYRQKHVLEMWGTGTQLRSRLDDSAEQITGGLGTFNNTTASVYVGGELAAFFNGAIHEFAFFDDELTSTERTEVRAFLGKMHPEITV